MHFFDNLQFGTVNFTMLPLTVLALIALALAFDFLNGFHDAANSVATVVSTRVLSPQSAVIWAAFFNFVAFLLFNLNVANTIGTGIIHPDIVTNQVIAATLVAACAWDILTWYWGLPTSSSHALIGGMVGAGLASSGWGSLVIAGIAKTALFIILAPIIGLVAGLAVAVAVYWLFRRATPRGVDTTFRRGQLLSAALYSLGHGGNDAQKTMGIIFVLLIAAASQAPESFAELKTEGHIKEYLPKKNEVVVTEHDGNDKVLAIGKDMKINGRPVDADHPAETIPVGETAVITWKAPRHIPVEVVLACHLAMGIGTLFGGWRIVKTMGQRIIRLRPVDGFCAETGAAVTLALTVFGGIPVSTTHTITGSIVGVGCLKRLSAVRWGIAGQVVWAWILTIPGAAVISALTYWALKMLP